MRGGGGASPLSQFNALTVEKRGRSTSFGVITEEGTPVAMSAGLA